MDWNPADDTPVGEVNGGMAPAGGPNAKVFIGNLAWAVTSEQLRECLEAAGLPRATPVLPLPDAERTLIVADTSSLHCRGLAEPGLTRRALRPMGAENDGGVKRSDPFRRGRS